MRARAKSASPKDSSANLGFEAKLWLAADKLRNNMDAAEPSGARQTAASSPKGERGGAKQYLAANVFWVPAEVRWAHLQAHAKQPTIGTILDDAMVAIERDNPRLKGVLPKDYGRPALDKHRLGELIDLIGTIGLGDRENREKDILRRVYEYFLGRFANAEGKRGGEFYTPQCVDKLLVFMIAPSKGRVYDPCDGSCGLFSCRAGNSLKPTAASSATSPSSGRSQTPPPGSSAS